MSKVQTAALALIDERHCTWRYVQEHDRRYKPIEVEAPDGYEFDPNGSVTLLCDNWADVVERLKGNTLVESDADK